MTLLSLVAALRRWCVVVIVGMAVTLLMAHYVGRMPGVWWTQADVIVLSPVNRFVPNPLAASPPSVVAAASALQREVSGGGGDPHVVADSVSIAGEGIREGQLVRLRNTGGQWANNFDRAVLNVQAVDATETRASARLQAVIARLRDTLERRQRESGVAPRNQMTIVESPAAPPVSYQNGSPTRSRAIVLALGSALVLAAVNLLESRRLRRRAQAVASTSLRATPSGGAARRLAGAGHQ